MLSIFLNDWKSKNHNGLQGLKALLEDFGIEEVKEKILIASYTYQDYEGDAYVLLRNDNNELFEVHGSHCSCHGLEGQWQLEKTSKESIKHRIFKGNLGLNWKGQSVFQDELKKVLELL